MELKIRRYFSPLVNTDDDDARALAAALNHLGYWQPDPRTGIVPFDPGYKFFDAIKKFQNDHGLFADGVLHPGGETEKEINAALKRLEESGQVYIWRTVGDGKVRAAHAGRDRQMFRWNKNLDGGHPGEDYNCRCWAEPYFVGYQAPIPKRKPAAVPAQPTDSVERPYPEVFLFSLLKIGQTSKVLLKLLKNPPKEKSKKDDLTEHGALRMQQRHISQAEKDEAIKTAQKTGNVTVKEGKYGTPQYHYKGSNGVTVIIETAGRNAGKTITSYRH